MTTKQIGRITVFKFSAFSVLIIFLLPILIGLLVKLSGDNDISISTFYQNLIGDTVINIPFIIIQTIVIVLGIWTIGAKAGESILTNNKGKFKTGFLTIFSLWGLLFISSSLTAGLMHSIKYGATGFSSAVTDWFVYGFFLYLFLGLTHALTIGYFIGKKIFLLGQKNNIVSADT